MIKIHNTTISDCVILEPDQYQDNRGIFAEIYKQSSIANFNPAQSNYSISKSGVLRGIHRTPYAKLVTCISGSIYDVCVDLRFNSKTYNTVFGIELNSNSLRSLYIPPYCGHGFLALEESVVFYHQGGEYDKLLDETYCYKNFNIKWPKEPLIISDKDSNTCDQTK